MFEDLYSYLVQLLDSKKGELGREKVEAIKMRRNLDYMYHLMAVIHEVATIIASETVSRLVLDDDFNVRRREFFKALARAQEKAGFHLLSGNVARRGLKLATTLLNLEPAEPGKKK